jgi:hypothetical protein
MLAATTKRRLDLTNPRYWQQNARMAIRDPYDALIEVITNADDRYVHLKSEGKIEVEVERRKGAPDILRVRDYADGMTSEDMDKKIARVGDRVSGLAEGISVRGTNSRGAKDIAILGGVAFESVAADGKYHQCRITARGEFESFPSEPVQPKIRKALGIIKGTGTVVTIEVEAAHRIPQHETLCRMLTNLVPLRDIMGNPKRTIIVRDLKQVREDVLRWSPPEGTERVCERFSIPGYPGAEAKLVIWRAKTRFETSTSTRSRPGGILVKSSHAIHESTLFAPELEHDPHASWFFGRLTCEYIDKLWNDYDDRQEQGLPVDPSNPQPIFDPMRKAGLIREHPFVKRLFGEALTRLRPLVEEERKREETSRFKVESEETRKRLNLLEKEATRFMEENRSDQDETREPDGVVRDSIFRQKGYSLSPPFAQILLGHSRKYWFNVSTKTFPELAVGSLVQIECATPEVSTSKKLCALETHPTLESTLRCVWEVRGDAVTHTTGIVVRIGPIVAEATIEVLASERDRYVDVTDLAFEHDSYRVRPGTLKSIRLLAPCPSIIATATPVVIRSSSSRVRISGETVLHPRPELGVAICQFRVASDEQDLRARLTAEAGGQQCEARLVGIAPAGAAIKIKLEPISLGNQRYRWRANVLEIATKHPSLNRYLGLPTDNFPGQEEKHFRVLLAEIVADAVCSQIVSRSASIHPEEYESADWDAYYAEYSRLLTQFLPLAHRSQIPD